MTESAELDQFRAPDLHEAGCWLTLEALQCDDYFDGPLAAAGATS